MREGGVVASGGTDENVDDAVAAKNESLLREVNERVEEMSGKLGTKQAEVDFVCECADTACGERVTLAAVEYEELRRHGSWFAVAPSDEHVFRNVERVVAKHERYWVVEKSGEAGRIATKLNPRTRDTDGASPPA
jgi:hypothetical protein